MVYFILLLLLLLPDIYISRNYIHEPILFILYWLPTVLAVFAVIALRKESSRKMLKILFSIVLVLGIPKLVFAVVSFLGWPLGMAYPPLVNIFNIIGFVLLAVTALCMLYGITLGWQWFRIDRRTFQFPNLPSNFNDFKIALVSDLHLGTFGKRRGFCRRLVRAVNEEKPDVILFIGDLVNSKAEEIKPFLGILPKFKAKMGVYSILGNHDYCIYGDFDNDNELKKNIVTIINAEKSFGWDILINENRELELNGQSLFLIGVENNGKPPFPQRADLRKALKGVPDNAFKILMSHDPTHWRQQVLNKTDIPLTLSGHTHGMQFSIFGFNPARLVYREWGGTYQENNQTLFVSIGVGGNMAFRFGAWAEFNVITLKKSSASN